MATTPRVVPTVGATAGPPSLEYLALLTVATVGSALLLGLGIAALLRRQSRPYLLVVGAIAALFGRSLVAGGSLLGLYSAGTHHALEHGLDAVLVAFVIAAVYYVRTVSQEVEPEP